MSALAASHPTLLDLAKRLDPDGKIDVIAEILTQENPILEDLSFVEGNLPTGHRTTIRTGLPTPTWRRSRWKRPARRPAWPRFPTRPTSSA